MSSKHFPRIQRPPKAAAGPKALAVAGKMVLKAMSPGKALKILNQLNQKNGVDCPGCAWPDPEKRSKLGEYCENGVKAIAEEAQSKLAGSDFFEKYSLNELRKQSDYWLGQQGRLERPMIVHQGESYYQPISWEEAFEKIGGRLKSLDDPDKAVFYTSGRTSNEAAFLYQLFVRKFGTNNLPDCSNMCHESSGIGLSETLGIGKGSVTMEDFDHAEVILIFGQNPGTNHPRMLSILEKAKKKGAKIIVINPLREAALVRFKNPQKLNGLAGRGTAIADKYLQVRINQDVPLLKAWMKLLIEREETRGGVLDQEFIEDRTQGFEELRMHLDTLDLNDLIRGNRAVGGGNQRKCGRIDGSLEDHCLLGHGTHAARERRGQHP